MRALADAARLRRFLSALSQDAHEETALYLTGGAIAVLLGWRESTVDADVLIVPRPWPRSSAGTSRTSATSNS